MTTYSWNDIKDSSEGDVLTLHGKPYRLVKKTSTAIAVEPYRWYHVLLDWIGRGFGSGV